MNQEKRYVTDEDVQALFPERDRNANKGDFGYIALVGGSLEYSGAIRLATIAGAAVRSGAGVVTVAAPRSICPIVANSIIEATLCPLTDIDGELVFREIEFERLCNIYDCIAFGMGIGNTEETLKSVEFLLMNYDKTLIIDADGLNAMANIDRNIIRQSKARLILTPHIKEFSRLSGEEIDIIKERPIESAMSLAHELDATVLLKGSTTVVAGANGDVVLCDKGTPGMATGGSGDVLSGILATICVNASDAVMATACGAYINGLAGELAENNRSEITMTALDTAMCIAEAIESIMQIQK